MVVLAVVGEIHAGSSAQELENGRQTSSLGGEKGTRTGGVLPVDIGMNGNTGQLASDSFGREDVVDAAAGNGAAWHTVILGRGLVLGERDAALGLDFRQAQSAIGARAGQDDADGTIACCSARARTK